SARLDAVLPALPAPLGPALAAAATPGELGLLGTLVSARLPLSVLDEVRTRRWAGAVQGTLADLDRFRGEPRPGLDVVGPGVLDLPVTEIDQAARDAAASGFFGRRKRLVAVRDRLTTVLRPGVTVAPKRLPALTAALVVLREQADALGARIAAIPGLVLPQGFNPFDDGARAGLDEQVERLRWAARAVDPAPNPAGHGTGSGVRPGYVEPLRRALSDGGNADPRPVHEAAAAATELASACRIPPDALAVWAGEQGLLGRWRATSADRGPAEPPHLPSLRRWMDLLGHVEPLRGNGMGSTRSAVLQGVLDPDDARRSFELGLARASVGERLRRTELDRFDAGAHERAISRFGTASVATREHLGAVLPQRVLSRRDFDANATAGRIGELRRQLGSRRGKKIRELMTSYGDLITRVLPCVLVSPDSLARFFPAAADQFDVVVFDEASQVRVADAVGAMGRGRSVVVVGDSKQMPPTSFAETASGGDDPESDTAADTVEDEESILTECVQARVPAQQLSWHYRSQDEALIAFSNQHYYGGELSSFPAPARDGAAVSLVRVDGHFHRAAGNGKLLRTNPIEAQAVVDDVVRRFDETPDALPSLGVVTFNLQQRAHVEGLLRDLDDPRIAAALDDPDGLFVKNLENVQGDERDTILFSTAFSVNDRGVLPLNFGPLNRAGGERRLNVAVTRARRQVVVFSSFDPAQMRTEETSSIGLRHLRTYLEMAAHGPSVLPRDRRRRSVPDRHRDQVADVLRGRGAAVRTDVGLSGFTLDLVLAEESAPDRPLVAVLLDGPDWGRRLTARDRDRLPHEVLGDVLGWPRVERIWMPSWLADPDAVADRLMAAVEDAHRAPTPEPALPVAAPVPPAREPDRPVARTAARADEPESPTLIAAGAPPAAVDLVWPGAATEFVPWAPRSLGPRDVLDALPERGAAARVRSALAEVVAAEGPIPAERLARLVANGFGLSKVAGARRDAILRHLPRDVRGDRAERVVWPVERDPEQWPGYRPAPDGQSRPIEDVPLREIGNAMVALVRASAGMPREELHRETLKVFGLRRRTGGVVERLDAALQLAHRSGRLRVPGDGTVTTGGDAT
ncbi:MAG: DUF3320 domain-containing protein, partial [Pseudonocardia sp.]|nr:DUF3320 domain-containing protein [Pseudonocardia sp.]